jgi:AcrR family transcriptional regulator
MPKNSRREESYDRILNTAEAIFAQFGYDGASLRQITRSAKVNLAAVNYHFGDKESLFREVVGRRFRSINADRLVKLQNAERAAGRAPVPLAEIIELMVRPAFELGTVNEGHGMRIIGRSWTEPLPFMEEILSKEFQPMMTRFGQAVRRHVPNLTPEDFLWRLSFVVGAMQHTLATMHRMKDLTCGICRSDDHEGALRRFIQFAVVTFTTPAASI